MSVFKTRVFAHPRCRSFWGDFFLRGVQLFCLQFEVFSLQWSLFYSQLTNLAFLLTIGVFFACNFSLLLTFGACFPGGGGVQEGKGPLRHSGKRPIKVGKRPIKEGKRPIKVNGQFSKIPQRWKPAPLKRPITVLQQIITVLIPEQLKTEKVTVIFRELIPKNSR